MLTPLSDVLSPPSCGFVRLRGLYCSKLSSHLQSGLATTTVSGAYLYEQTKPVFRPLRCSMYTRLHNEASLTYFSSLSVVKSSSLCRTALYCRLECRLWVRCNNQLFAAGAITMRLRTPCSTCLRRATGRHLPSSSLIHLPNMGGCSRGSAPLSL